MNLFPMRVLLISANLCEDPYPVYPLGISVIAGALSEEGHSVRQLDLAPCARDGSWKETLSEVYRTFRPGLIGLGIRNVDSVNSRDEKEESLLDFPLEVARFCKENFPEQLILGGAGFSLLPDLLLERSGADYAVAGEGEESVRELVRALEKGEKPVRHLLRGKRPLRQSAPLYQEDITEYYCRESHVIPLQSKRGCPFRCVYCSYPALEGRTIRARDPESVVRDMLFLHRKHPDAVLATVIIDGRRIDTVHQCLLCQFAQQIFSAAASCHTIQLLQRHDVCIHPVDYIGYSLIILHTVQTSSVTNVITHQAQAVRLTCALFLCSDFRSRQQQQQRYYPSHHLFHVISSY